jgi:N-acetylglucosamine-6-phosphate deacetylase
MIAITAQLAYTPLEGIEKPIVLIEGETILSISSRHSQELPAGTPLIDFKDAILTPGFVDIHIHGGAGHDVMRADAEGFSVVEQLIAAHGVTAYLPTTITAPMEQTLQALDRLADEIEAGPKRKAMNARAMPLGIHLEGPFLGHARRGVHPPDQLMKPSVQTFDRFWQAARGHIKIMTIAPELEGACEVVAAAVRRGVCISMGHSDATLAQTRAGVNAGARNATHIFNAMRPLDHREPGILGEVLTNPQITAEIIADGIHVDPLIVKLVLQAKGLEKTVLVTDATPGTAMPDGHYRLGTFEFEVKDGKAVCNGKLAGSTLTMDRAVRNAQQFAGINLQQALRPATLNPARVAGLDGRGKLEAGARADILVMNSAGEIQRTIVGGQGL